MRKPKTLGDALKNLKKQCGVIDQVSTTPGTRTYISKGGGKLSIKSDTFTPVKVDSPNPQRRILQNTVLKVNYNTNQSANSFNLNRKYVKTETGRTKQLEKITEQYKWGQMDNLNQLGPNVIKRTNHIYNGSLKI